MIEALDYYDKEALVYDFIIEYHKDIGNEVMDHFEYLFKSEALRKLDLDPVTELDHDLPFKLELHSIEKEVFYLTHYVCYSLEIDCESILNTFSRESLRFALTGKSRQDTAKDIKDWICQKQFQYLCSISGIPGER